MVVYTVRILHRPSGRPLFTGPGLRSPERAGQVTAGAYAALVRRDGHDADQLELRSSVTDQDGTRQMRPDERAVMDSALREAVTGFDLSRGPFRRPA